MASAFRMERFFWFELCHTAKLIIIGMWFPSPALWTCFLLFVSHLDLCSEQWFATLVLFFGLRWTTCSVPGKGGLGLTYLGPALWSYSLQWCCCFGVFQHYCQEPMAERESCSFWREPESTVTSSPTRAILTGTTVTLWVFSRIEFDTEPEWTFLTFFPFCHPACFRKSPDVGVCILSLSSLTVFVFQAWQQWKET